jgi:hypothetical protein
MGTEFFLAGMKAQWEECGGRILLVDKTVDRSDCSVLEFGFKIYFVLYTCTRV